MPRPTKHSVHRSLAALSIGVVKAQQRRENELGPIRLAERDVMIQVKIAGQAFAVMSDWATIDLDFPYVFTNDRNVRDAQTDRPHFTYGAENVTGPPVMIAATVTRWKETPEGEVTGAVVRVATQSSVDDGSHFTAKAHLTFTGYTSPADTPDEEP